MEMRQLIDSPLTALQSALKIRLRHHKQIKAAAFVGQTIYCIISNQSFIVSNHSTVLTNARGKMRPKECQDGNQREETHCILYWQFDFNSISEVHSKSAKDHHLNFIHEKRAPNRVFSTDFDVVFWLTGGPIKKL